MRSGRLGGLLAGTAMLVAGCTGLPLADSETDYGSSGGTPACYWLSNTGEGWVEFSDTDQASCFHLDSCSGGDGASGGGCYKWATGPNASPLPWSGHRAPL